MTTQPNLERMARELDAARYRSERAAEHGDRAGALIAAGDARAIAARLNAAALANVTERQTAEARAPRPFRLLAAAASAR